MQGVRVQSLVGELRSHMPQGAARKNKKDYYQIRRQETEVKKNMTSEQDRQIRVLTLYVLHELR